ncbi:MAG: SH3 domain-containing protein [Anaerolineae bacterium]|nr:SH3 domain-containing protein [Anaerolineae bacterium]
MTRRSVGIIVTLIVLVVVVGLLVMAPMRTVAPLPTALPPVTATLFYVTPTPSFTLTPTITPTPSDTPTPTDTPLPSATPTPTAPPTATPVPDTANAHVQEGWQALNLREQPGTAGAVLDTLEAFAPLVVIGRTEDGSWVQVIVLDKAKVGWVMAEYIDIDAGFDLTGVPVAGEVVDIPAAAAPQPAAPGQAPAASQPGALISGVSSNVRQIYLHGLQMGNRGNVFAKVGDSITHSDGFLHAIGHGDYNLHGYTYLQPALNFFIATPVQGANSFSRTSFAAFGGWTVRNVLQPGGSHAGECDGQTPLECEYNFVKPAVSIIMLGTNDSGGLPLDEFDASMRTIVQKTIDMGIIPVLSTIPPKNTGHPNDGRVTEFNQVIINIARQYDIPLIDYHTAMLALPGYGLDADGVHPSLPGEWVNGTGDFSETNLQTGATLRNFLTLQMLDALWRYVLYDYTPGTSQSAPTPGLSIACGGDLVWRVDGITGLNAWTAGGSGGEYRAEPH